jgi:hypothetical protein
VAELGAGRRGARSAPASRGVVYRRARYHRSAGGGCAYASVPLRRRTRIGLFCLGFPERAFARNCAAAARSLSLGTLPLPFVSDNAALDKRAEGLVDRSDLATTYLVETGIGHLGSSSLRMIHRMADPRTGAEIARAEPIWRQSRSRRAPSRSLARRYPPQGHGIGRAGWLKT